MESTVSSDAHAQTFSSIRMAIRILLLVLTLSLYIAGLFLCAGRLDWMRGWIFILLHLCGQTIHTLYLMRRNPEVIRHRRRVGKGTKAWDKRWLALFVILFLATVATAALDAGRYGWSNMPAWLGFLGGAFYILSMVILTWAMAVNPFFEKTVRIQHDRNHRVVDAGPYRIVRHPGYLGVIAGFTLAVPLLLGSWWAMIPAVMTAVWVVFRTAMEDQTLRGELEGYQEYAERVRCRLIPFVW